MSALIPPLDGSDCEHRRVSRDEDLVGDAIVFTCAECGVWTRVRMADMDRSDIPPQFNAPVGALPAAELDGADTAELPLETNAEAIAADGGRGYRR